MILKHWVLYHRFLLKVNLEIEINHIISTDDYYNEFLSAGYVVLMNDKSFYTILNQYNNQTPDSLLDAKEYNAAITPYQSKNYVVEVDRIKNLKSVEKEISQISNNFITYDQYNSVTDMVDVYKEERKRKIYFYGCSDINRNIPLCSCTNECIG